MPVPQGGQQNAASSIFANLSSEALQAQFFNTLSGGNTITRTTTITTSTTSQNGNSVAQGQTQNSNGQNLVCPDPNSYLSNSNCYCLPGFYNINGACQKCPDGTYYNGTTCVATSQTPTQQQVQVPFYQPQPPTSQPGTIAPGNTLGNLPNLPVSIPSPNTNVTVAAGSSQVSVLVPGQSNNVSVINVPSGVDPSIFFPPGLIP